MINQNLYLDASNALKKAALNEEAKQFILENELIYKILKKAANRYIAGETIDEASKSIKLLNQKGFEVTTDFMGESIRTEKEANEATNEFVSLIQNIHLQNLNSSVSLDLSHIGLLVDKDLASFNLNRICLEAQKIGKEVILSMEGADRTDLILDIYKDSIKIYSNLGITIQAYLYRTKEDIQDLINLKGSIRLVKGAYDVSPNISLSRSKELDDVYLKYTQTLLSLDKKCSIASHDTKIHTETIRMIEEFKPKNYTLERLLGIQNEEFESYLNQGYNCRMYVVYGKEWYLYLCNRLAEYPLNLLRAISDIGTD